MKKMRCCCFLKHARSTPEVMWWKRKASTPGSSSRSAASCLCVWAGGGCRVHCVGALVAVGLWQFFTLCLFGIPELPWAISFSEVWLVGATGLIII